MSPVVLRSCISKPGWAASSPRRKYRRLQPGTTITSDIRSETKAGWTFGGGTEVALDARWSARLEYLYIDAGKSKRTSVISSPFFGVQAIDSNFSNRFHVVRAGLNYSFNAPVVAKY